MDQADLKRFGVLLSILQETFSPDKPFSKQRTKIYFEILKDIPIENMELAVKELMKRKRYPVFPLPSEIRKAAGFDEEEDIELKALEAFQDACGFAYSYGQERAMTGKGEQHEDPIVEETIRLCFGGWEYFQDTDPKNETWDKKNFIEIYKKLFQVKQRDKLLSQAEVMKQLRENRKEIKTLEEEK